MDLYIIRHGQTDWNVQHKIQGKLDTELNDAGINQAKKAKEEFNKYDFDLIICSPLKRTKLTAKIINEDKNVEIIYDNALLERGLGDFEGLSSDLIDDDLISNYKLNLNYNNIEPVVQLCDRVFNLLNYIKENLSDKKILLVTHSGTARAIEAYFYGISKNGDLPPETLKNCEIRKYVFKN